jgi:UDP-N-acetylglucosamine:LPS N-acetylglucosamine transferase
VLVLASGNRDELAWYESVAASLPGARLVKNEWPAMELLTSTDVVVGGAGYNTVHECAACQVPLVAHAWPRLYDRQRLRAELVSRRARIALVETPAEAQSAVAAFLAQAVAHAPSDTFDNGADRAADILTCGH